MIAIGAIILSIALFDILLIIGASKNSQVLLVIWSFIYSVVHLGPIFILILQITFNLPILHKLLGFVFIKIMMVQVFIVWKHIAILREEDQKLLKVQPFIEKY